MNKSFLDKELEEVRSIIVNSIEIENSLVEQSISEILLGGGKFLRPKIVILSALTGKYDAEHIRPLAASVELLHAATLIHDDVIDDSPLRRGIPAVHTRVGQKDAVLGGDYLFSRCIQLASNATNSKNSRYLASAMSLMIKAELYQNKERWNFNPSLRSYIRKTTGKTAVLFSLAARVGAEEARCKQSWIGHLTRSAIAAGIAFQIWDDILDWTADESVLGKSVMNDLSEGLCTAPLVFALKEKNPKLQNLLQKDALAHGSTDEVKALVFASGAIEQARSLALSYRERAVRVLEYIPVPFVQEELHTMYSSFVTRAY